MIERNAPHATDKEESGMLRFLLITFLVFSVIFAFTAAHAAEETPNIAPVPAAYQLAAKDVEEAVGKALSQLGAGENVRASINGAGSKPLYESASAVEVEIKSLAYDAKALTWSANLLVAGNNEVLTARPLEGRFQHMARLPVLARMIRAGTPIAEADIAYQEFPKTYLRDGVATDASQIVGLTPRGAISANRPLRVAELSAPVAVKRGDLVKISYRAGLLSITASGQAVTAGAKGETIEVRNVNTQQVLHATVTDAGQVSLSAPEQQLSQLNN